MSTLESLPNDILDIIYKMKHQLEMKDIKTELGNRKRSIIEYIWFLYNDYCCDLNIYFYEPERIVELLTILRNEDEIDDTYLENIIDEITNDIYSNFRIFYDDDILIIDKEYYMNNSYITTHWFLAKYKFMGNSDMITLFKGIYSNN